MLCAPLTRLADMAEPRPPPPAPRTQVAGPRMGNAAFASLVRASGPRALHLVHAEDEVLASNVELWDRLGFEHVGQVVRCPRTVWTAAAKARLFQTTPASGMCHSTL